MKYPCLKFGSKQDFEIARIELEWIRSRRKLKLEDFRRVSHKYNLPVDFLKKGIEGLELDDYLISKSEWFPIIYSWRFQAIETERDFVKSCIDYVRSDYFSKRFFVYTLAFLVYLGFYFVAVLNRTIEDFVLTMTIPVLLFGLEIFIELRAKASEKKSKRDEFARQMILRGFGQNVDSTIEFVDKQWKTAIFAPQRLIDAPSISLFRLDKLKGKEFEEAKKRTPKEWSVYPKFYGENSGQAYKKRIDELLCEKSKE